MMKSILAILIFLLSFKNSFSQGLNSEINFNNAMVQYSIDLTNFNEYTYFTSYENTTGQPFNKLLLTKTDTLGNIIWNNELDFIPSSLVVTSDSNIVISGNSFQCDVFMYCTNYIQKFDTDGNLLWTKSWFNSNCNNFQLTGLSVDSSNIYINYMQSDTSAILHLDYAGNLLDSLPISQKNLIQIQKFGSFEKIAVSEDSLFGFDTNGNVTFSKGFNSSIQNISSLNDTLYLLTSDSIFIYDSTLLMLNSNNILGYSDFSHLKISNHKIRFLSHGLSNENIITLNHSLQLLDVLVIPESIPESTPKDFSESHFTAAINYELYEYQSVRHLDFSLQSNQNEIINRTDIGVIDIQETQVSCNPYNSQIFSGVYNFTIHANVLIKNYGNQVLTECKLNHFITLGICEYVVYFEHFTGLNVAPGDSIWLTCGQIHSELEFLSGTDTLRENICVYTSHPNSITDLNVPNDAYCESIVVGYVGINELEKNELEIYPNPASNFIRIENEMLENYSYSIYSIHGKLIKEGNLISQEIFIPDLSSGTYILKLNALNGGKSFHTRFIKE